MDNKILVIAAIIIIVLLFLFVSEVTGYGIFSSRKVVKLQCSDAKDNDGDGKCDYSGCYIGRGVNKKWLPADPDCVSAQDNREACESSLEVCDNKDNDCDGSIDENLVQQCGVSNVGECRYGTSACSGGDWGACVGNINPVNESCDGKDNDCDSVTDEGCECIGGQTRACGTDVGECAAGTQTCSRGNWSACIGEITPTTEICDNKDNDCDGVIDDGVCIQNCSDSDNGWDILVKGTVSGYSGGSSYSYTDWCNGTLLTEGYCSGTSPASGPFGCVDNNYTSCSDGRCV